MKLIVGMLLCGTFAGCAIAQVPSRRSAVVLTVVLHAVDKNRHYFTHALYADWPSCYRDAIAYTLRSTLRRQIYADCAAYEESRI